MKKWDNFVKFIKADTWQSWIFCLILLFVGIKFVFFPLLSLALGVTQTTPLVVIETGSMHHDGGLGNILKLQKHFDNYWSHAGDWYVSYNISKQQFEKFPFKTGMEIGDMLLLSKRGRINVGDVIVFDAGQSRPIIHRVIAIRNESGKIIYSTKGDANPSQLGFENNIEQNKIMGKCIAIFPRLGYPKVIAARILGI